jgi:SNF2 family DNA or RNA helicase
MISVDILAAQVEADKIVDQEEQSLLEGDEMLAPIPKMLALDQATLKIKTKDLKARGEQLDLLLLKAESYSHFIRTNQENNQKAANILQEKQEELHRMNGETAGDSSTKRRKVKDVHLGGDGTMSSGIIEQPSNLVGGTLKPYQMDGLRWLVSLWENGLSGILGDEMGLGKTIQVVSLIAFLRTTSTAGPFLIAGPLATLPNWMNEFKKWLPSCPVVLYHGNKEERARIRRECMHTSDMKKMTFPVVVTSFEICMIDRGHLEQYQWQYIILDEGHRIKNRNCKLVKELKAIRSVSRLLLTGTPIQNSLEELWSLLNFVNPRIFDDLEVFQAWFGYVSSTFHLFLLIVIYHSCIYQIP